MALTYCSLASGSSGNCLWVRGGGTELLLDCGISARRIGRGLEALGTRLEAVAGVVCTHGHDDHVSGAPVLLRRHGRRLWATAGTRAALPRDLPAERVERVARTGTVRIGGLTVQFLPTSHDAPESAALLVRDADTALAVVTDLGAASAEIAGALGAADGLVLEFNHDEQMLEAGPYPGWLKRRIHGRFGHLSNLQAGELLRQAADRGLQHLTLAHLSEENNSVDRARAAAESALGLGGFSARLVVAHRHLPGEPVTLRARAPRKGQLCLPFGR